MGNIIEKLSEIQGALNAPKSNFNKFGNYSYRNCEDILKAVKPLLDGGVILLNDEIQLIGDRFYVCATATFKYEGDEVSVKAYARESLDKKGMDASQITGSTSSYARKYSLNGLLLIDDNKDADSMDNTKNKPHPNSKVSQAMKKKEQGNSKLYKVISGFLADEARHDFAREALAEITDEEEKQALWRLFTSKEKEIVRTFKTL